MDFKTNSAHVELKCGFCFLYRLLGEIKISQSTFICPFTDNMSFHRFLGPDYDSALIKQFYIKPCVVLQYLKNDITFWSTSWQNQQNDFAPSEDRSASASTQSDQSLCCPHDQTFDPWLPTEHPAKTLIRLSGRPGWSESLLGTHIIKLVLTWGGSFLKNDITVYTFDDLA